MNIDLTGHCALVTGAAQGIAQAIARQLAESGATVHVADLDAVAVRAFGAAQGMPAHVVDIGDRAQVQHTVAQVMEACGRIDILINGAGGVRGQVGRPIEEITEKDWSAPRVRHQPP